MEFREIGQTARLPSRSLGDSLREEGGHGRRDSTWPVRPADERAGFSSVVLAGSPVAVPRRHQRPTGYQPEDFRRIRSGHEEHKRLGL